jgi:hypothetical protein
MGMSGSGVWIIGMTIIKGHLGMDRLGFLMMKLLIV